MKNIIGYMKKLFQKVEREPLPTQSLLKPPELRVSKLVDPLAVYDEDISDRIGHINFNRLRKAKDLTGDMTRDFYNDEGSLID